MLAGAGVLCLRAQCADVIYQFAVLDCAHSYCRSCISEWFRKKKCCPVCRGKHKGTLQAVRAADNTIDVLVQQLLLPEAKAERLQRTQRIDAEQRVAAAKQAEKEQAKLAQLMRLVDQQPHLLLPPHLAAGPDDE